MLVVVSYSLCDDAYLMTNYLLATGQRGYVVFSTVNRCYSDYGLD